VVTIDNPPNALRPGLSASAKIETAQKKDVLTVPIQALAMRTQSDLDEAQKEKNSSVTLAAPKPAAGDARVKKDVQGIFVIRGKKAEFIPVQTGISGVTDIEVTSGLKDGDEIVIGNYKALRTLRPGASIKVDNSAPKHDDTSSQS
jgi:HlyD family secretion protein